MYCFQTSVFVRIHIKSGKGLLPIFHYFNNIFISPFNCLHERDQKVNIQPKVSQGSICKLVALKYNVLSTKGFCILILCKGKAPADYQGQYKLGLDSRVEYLCCDYCITAIRCTLHYLGLFH